MGELSTVKEKPDYIAIYLGKYLPQKAVEFVITLYVIDISALVLVPLGALSGLGKTANEAVTIGQTGNYIGAFGSIFYYFGRRYYILLTLIMLAGIFLYWRAKRDYQNRNLIIEEKQKTVERPNDRTNGQI
jgi:hypothetical protein